MDVESIFSPILILWSKEFINGIFCKSLPFLLRLAVLLSQCPQKVIKI